MNMLLQGEFPSVYLLANVVVANFLNIIIVIFVIKDIYNAFKYILIYANNNKFFLIIIIKLSIFFYIFLLPNFIVFQDNGVIKCKSAIIDLKALFFALIAVYLIYKLVIRITYFMLFAVSLFDFVIEKIIFCLNTVRMYYQTRILTVGVIIKYYLDHIFSKSNNSSEEIKRPFMFVKDISNTSCIICMCNFENYEDVNICGKCKVGIHHECLKEWTERSGQDTCIHYRQ